MQTVVKVFVVEVDDASSWSSESGPLEDRMVGGDLCLNPAEEGVSERGGWLSHHGEPVLEVEIIDDSEEEAQGGPKVLKVPRTLTQAEVDAHLAAHLPHAVWCSARKEEQEALCIEYERRKL